MPAGGEIGQAWWEADLKDEKLKAKLRELDGLLRQHGQTSEQALNRGWSQSIDAAGQSLQKLGGGMTKVGDSMTRNLTVPIVGLGAATGKMAFDFDETMSQIVALTSVGRQEIGGFRDEILALAPAVGKGPQELAEAFYFVASAGFEGAEAMEVLKITSQAAAAGLGDTATVAQVVGSAINAYGRENLTAVQATDALVAAIGEGSAEAPEFAGALGNVIGSAAQIGASFPDVTGAIAAMTNVGVGAAESVTSLNQVFTTLFKPTSEAAEALAEYGLTAAGLRQMIAEEGLMPTLALLAEKFEGNAEATSLVFGNVRALRGVLALTGGDMERTSALLDRVADSAGATGEAFSSVAESDSFKMRQALAELQAEGIKLGADVLPVLVDVIGQLAGGAREFGKWWGSLDDDTKRLIVQAAGFIAIAGPLLSITGKLVGGFGGLLRAVAWLGGPAGTSALGRFGAAARGALGPLGLAIGALAAITAMGEDVYKALDPVGRSFNELATKVGKSRVQIDGEVNQLAHDLGRSADDIKRELTDLLVRGVDWDRAVEAVRTGTAAMTRSVEEEAESYDQALLAFATSATGRTGEAADALAGLPPDAQAALDALGITVDTGAGEAFDPIGEEAVEARQAALDHMDALISGIATLFDTDESVRDAWQALIDRMDDPYTEAERRADIFSKDTVQNIRDAITSGDPKVADDTRLLVENMLGQIEAMEPGALSSGEAVPPAIRDGMDASMNQLIDWIEQTLVPEGLDSLTMDEADEIGLGNIWRYQQGMKRNAQLAIDEAARIARLAEFQLHIDASGGGWSIISSWIGGMENAYVNNQGRVWGIVDGVKRAFGGSLPTEGPLKGGAGSGGISIGESWIGGITGSVRDGMGDLYSSVAGVSAALTVGASGFAFESGVASLAPAPATDPASVSRGTIVYHREVHLHTEGPVPVATEDELSRLLDRTQWVAEEGAWADG